MSYAYPYAQIFYLGIVPGSLAWPQLGQLLVVVATGLSLASLLTLGRWFGIRPALCGLAQMGPYGLVRHPLYLAYLLADIGFNCGEWNGGTVLLTTGGWAMLLCERWNRLFAWPILLAGEVGGLSNGTDRCRGPGLAYTRDFQ